MFCPSCGKQIPDESTFCLHCGKRVSNRREIRDTPPIAIDRIHLYLVGPTDVKALGGGFFGADTEIGRGFAVAVSLVDESNKLTTSDGELIVALKKESSSFHKLLGANPQVLLKAKKESNFYTETTVKKKGFG